MLNAQEVSCKGQFTAQHHKCSFVLRTKNYKYKYIFIVWLDYTVFNNLIFIISN